MSKVMSIDGLPVEDATKTITLLITSDDVRQGRSKKPDKCAAAIACRRLLKGSEARVHIGRTYLKFGNKWKRYITSEALRSEIVAFDRGGKFEPGEYTLNKMQPSRQGDTSRAGPNKKNGGRGKKRGKYHLTGDVRRMELYV